MRNLAILLRSAGLLLLVPFGRSPRLRATRRARRVRGYLWFVWHYGLRALVRYERDRRAGMTLDYARIFTPEERAILEEHGLAPWSREQR